MSNTTSITTEPPATLTTLTDADLATEIAAQQRTFDAHWAEAMRRPGAKIRLLQHVGPQQPLELIDELIRRGDATGRALCDAVQTPATEAAIIALVPRMSHQNLTEICLLGGEPARAASNELFRRSHPTEAAALAAMPPATPQTPARPAPNESDWKTLSAKLARRQRTAA